MAYKKSTVTTWEYKTPRNQLPLVVDDFSLAMHLGIRCKTLWFLIHGSREPASSPKSLYQEGSLLKRGAAGKAGKRRIIHIPDPRLKRVQKMMDSVFVQPIPVGEHACAYEKGRVPVDTARLCGGNGILLSLDLKDFFGKVRYSWVRDLFTAQGYSRYVAGLMAHLACCTTSHTQSNSDGTSKTITRRFMPQGTPVSPTLANRVADMRFDQRILKMAEEGGWSYYRYSDNIYLTHPEVLPREAVDAFKNKVIQTVHKAGWGTHKVRVTPQWKRQEVLGLVVNEKANLRSEEYRSLRALIHNCATYGFPSQVEKARKLVNLKIETPESLIAHLRGKLSYVGQVLCDSRRNKLFEEFEAAMESERLRIKESWAEEDQGYVVKNESA